MISVIVPIYNTGKYLNKCLKSIQNQTFQNFECVIVDDASTDIKTKTIAKKFCKLDSRFKYYENNVNLGIEKTRIVGIEKSNAEYVIFSDHDDYYEKDAFQIYFNKITSNNADVVVSNYYFQRFAFPNFRNKVSYITSDFSLNRNEFMNEYYVNFFGLKKFSVSTWAKIYRKKILSQIDFKTLDYNYWEDVIINLQIFEKISKVVFIKDHLYTHIYGGLSSKFNPIFVFDVYDEVYFFRLDYLKKNNLMHQKKYVDFESIYILLLMCSKMIEYNYNFDDFKKNIEYYKSKKSYLTINNEFENEKFEMIQNNREKELFDLLRSNNQIRLRKYLRIFLSKFSHRFKGRANS